MIEAYGRLHDKMPDAPQALTHPYSTMTMAGNTLFPWNGRQEKGMKNQDLSVLLSMIQKKKRLLDIQNHFGEAEQTGDVLRRRI